MRAFFAVQVLLSASVLVAAPSITISALPNPIVGKPASGAVWTLSATGGTVPYTWSVISGALPTGLSLSAAGVITGTATAAGAATFTVQVADAASSAAGEQFTITAQYALGVGCTTATIIDRDCDYYGVGSALGPDADDNDPAVNTPASMLAKYGTLANFLSTVKGYNPNHIWYLATTGNDSTCTANDATKPCATWASAVSKSSAGDAVVVRGGTWSIAASYSIGGRGATALHPDYYLAYPGEKPILDHSACGWYGVVAQWGNPSYTVIDGLTIWNTPCAPGPSAGSGTGIGFTVDSITLAGIVIRNNDVSDYKWDVSIIAGQTGTLIENNSLHDTLEHPIYVGVNDGDTGLMSGMIVRNNLLYNAGRDNFHNNGRCSGCSLDANIMYSANMYSGGGAPNIQFQQGWNHSTVSNNIVFTASAYAMLFNDYDDPTPNTNIHPYDQNYNLIVNNTFIHTGRDATGQNLSGSCFSVFGAINNSVQTSPLLDLGHNTYSNNIFVEGATGGGTCGAVVRYYKNQSADLDWLSTDTWANNIIYASNGAAPLSVGTQPITNFAATQQNWAYFTSHAAAFTNNLQTDPKLVAWNPAWYATPSNFNLALQFGSPAIGGGLFSGAPSKDIHGTPLANPPDIGAYQYRHCDLNGDGSVDVLDVLSAINQVIGVAPCTNADLTGNGVCDVVDVQRVIIASLGGICLYH